MININIGYGLGFDVNGTISFSNDGEVYQNVIIFCVWVHLYILIIIKKVVVKVQW